MVPRYVLGCCLLLAFVAGSQAAGPAGGVSRRVTRVALREEQQHAVTLRLRGGGPFGIGDKPKDDTHKPENAEWLMRSTSHSVLDESRIREPGLGEALHENKTVSAGVSKYEPASKEETEEFAKKAKAQAETRDHLNSEGGTQCRVKAALEALENSDNAERYEDFKRYNVVLAASEHASYAKTGGLADVVDKLSIALALRGHRAMTVIPMYGNYDGVICTGVQRGFGLFGGGHTVQYFHKWLPLGKDRWGNETGVDQIFVEHPCFKRPGMYGEWGKDYDDNLMRFGLFSWAAIEAPLCLPTLAPFGEEVIYLANDWQTGLLPLILTSHYRRHRALGAARCVFVVHNMGYQGVYPNPPNWESPKFSLHDFGLRDNAYYDKYVWTFPIEERPSKGRDPRDDGEAIKLLRGGIEMADRVVTVAPSYKDEMMSYEGGWGLHDTVRGRAYHLDGILNGIDIKDWDPSSDPRIAAHFSAEDPGNKTLCKKALQAELGLEHKENTPIVAFIGRLAPQKGVDLIEQVFGWLMGGDSQGVTGDVQLIMMGSGEGQYADFLMNAERHNKGRVVGYVGFSPEMEHKIIAGADILLMPSRYEPCGLPQMYAQRYGTVPVVHATGGLEDSVVQYDPFADAVEVEEEEEEAVEAKSGKVKVAAGVGAGAGGEEGEGVGEGEEDECRGKTKTKTKVVEAEGHGTGWQFGNADAEGLKFGLWNALHTYKKFPASWKKMVKRCMKTDFSWELSAKKYEQVFSWATMDGPFQNPWPFN